MNKTVTTASDQRERGEDADLHRELDTCPECSGSIQPNTDRGEHICAECGLVLGEDEIDHGPEWRTFSDEETDERSRVGAPVTELLHDKGLSTTIGWQNKDAYGNSLSSQKRAQIQRLRTWDERFRTKSASERNLKQAFGEIDRMASGLGLPKPCRETAAVIYRTAVDENLLPGRSIEAMATASLYAAARQHDSPRSLPTIERVSRVDKLSVQRAYRYLSRELELAIAPADPLQYVGQFASDLEISDEAERLARDILDVGKRKGIHSGRNPAGLAAAAVYAAALLANERVTQATVSEVTDMSKVTIRERYQELLEVYGDHG